MTCETCNDTGKVLKATGGGTKPRMPGTPQVYGCRLEEVPCLECWSRELRKKLSELPAMEGKLLIEELPDDEPDA